MKLEIMYRKQINYDPIELDIIVAAVEEIECYEMREVGQYLEFARPFNQTTKLLTEDIISIRVM